MRRWRPHYGHQWLSHWDTKIGSQIASEKKASKTDAIDAMCGVVVVVCNDTTNIEQRKDNSVETFLVGFDFFWCCCLLVLVRSENGNECCVVISATTSGKGGTSTLVGKAKATRMSESFQSINNEANDVLTFFFFLANKTMLWVQWEMGVISTVLYVPSSHWAIELWSQNAKLAPYLCVIEN